MPMNEAVVGTRWGDQAASTVPACVGAACEQQHATRCWLKMRSAEPAGSAQGPFV